MSKQNAFSQITDSIRVVEDTVNVATFKSDSLNADTLSAAKKKGDIETTIKYSATDSIRMDVEKKIVYLFGNAKIDYGQIALEAEKIEINWANNTLTAYGGQDSTGKTIGIPLFKQGADSYTSEVIRYNFKTKKGLISKLITQQGEGYIHGETVKRGDEKLYVHHAQYTTCNLAHPHFYISATKMKLIPDNKIISGPFNLVISDVPTPLGFVLGMFPVPKKNKSGLIFPAYGEHRDQGFYLQRLGWYFAVSDYLGIKVTGDIYSRGTKAIYIQGGYRKRYGYSGNLGFNLFNRRDNLDETFIPSTFYNVSWLHSTDATGKSSSFTASVNISSSKYYSQNSFNPNTRLANDFASSISFRKTFANTPFSLNMNASHSQNVGTKKMFVTLPDVAFTMNRIFPFRKKGKMGKAWYEQVSVSYNMNTKLSFDNAFASWDTLTNAFVQQNKGLTLRGVDDMGYILKGEPGPYYKYGVADTLTNDPTVENAQRIRLNGAQYGARHTIPLQTSIKLFKKFSLNPSLVYTEYWYPGKENYTLTKTTSGDRDSLIQTYDRGFSRAWGWSTSGTSLRTNIYGTLNFKKGKLMGLRHTVVPVIGYSYSPDLTNPVYGAFQDVKDPYDNMLYRQNIPYRVSQFQRYSQLYGFPNGRKSSAISFQINNMLEGKMKNPDDTVNPTKKFKILDNLSLNGSYDFLATRNKFSNIAVAGRTNIKNGKIEISFNSVFDPYLYKRDSLSRQDIYKNYRFIRTDSLMIKSGGLAVMRYSNLSVRTSLNPKAKNSQSANLSEEDKETYKYIQANAEQYVDFNIPWNLRLGYQLNILGKKFMYGMKKPIATHNLQMNGDVSITENWKVTFSSSYDIVNERIAFFTLGILRDLHCWQMMMNVSQYDGVYNYNFTINAKASLLQDLRLMKRSPGMINAMQF